MLSRRTCFAEGLSNSRSHFAVECANSRVEESIQVVRRSIEVARRKKNAEDESKKSLSQNTYLKIVYKTQTARFYIYLSC